MKRIPLYAMAHARSGDKGEGSNVGVLAYDDRGYELLKAWLTPARVKSHFGEIVRGFEREAFLLRGIRRLAGRDDLQCVLIAIIAVEVIRKERRAVVIKRTVAIPTRPVAVAVIQVDAADIGDLFATGGDGVFDH